MGIVWDLKDKCKIYGVKNFFNFCFKILKDIVAIAF